MSSFLYLALSNAVLATVLAAIVVILTCICRRPLVRHALWLLVLLKLVTPPLMPLSVSWPHREVGEPQAAESLPPSVIVPSASELDELVPPLSEASLSIGTATQEQRPSPPLPHGRGSGISPALLAVWLVGALLWWTIAAVRLRRFQRVLRRALLAPVEVQEQARRLASLLGVRRCPPIVFSSAPLSPMLWALSCSPRLLVPAELWHKLTTEQQDTLLAHELAHLRRGDHWVRRLELLVLGLYWWHPVVWWAQRRLQEAEEECCDALVVSILPDFAPAYASALVQTVAFLSQARPAALLGASGAGHVPLLKRRLTVILSSNPSSRPSRLVFWIVLGLGMLFLPLTLAATNPEESEPQSNEEPARKLASPGRDSIHDPSVDPHLKLHILAAGMQNCASCHDAGSVRPQDLQKKPESWREAHDEIVRLLDEVRRRQTQLQKATTSPPASAAPDRSRELEQLQDEIELLKVKVRIKQVHREATSKTLNEYQRRLMNYEEINKRQPGTVPVDTIMETRLARVTREGQLQIDEMELQEVQIRLKQAERRLARLQPAKPRAEPPVINVLPAESGVVTGWNVTWAEALFEKRGHDFGTVKQGTICEHTFVMTNHGQRPVTIDSVRTSAGCLTATLSQRELPPGGQATIRTRLDTSKFTGRKILRVLVQFEKPDREEIALGIHADSQPSAPRKLQNPARLQELEKKLDALRKEMENLRREMGPDKPQ